MNFHENHPLQFLMLRNWSDTVTRNQTMEEHIFWMPWWQQFLFITAFAILIVLAAVGNLVVIWIVLAHKRMRTVTNYFLVNLAVADTLISFLNTVFTSTFLLYQDWWYGLSWCKFTTFISICTVTASVLTLMAIAIDRYV
jgi:tachykinin-like receptor